MKPSSTDSSRYLEKSILNDLFLPGDPESIQGFSDFLKIFEESCTQNLSKLATAVSRVDFPQIMATAHNLKGIAANIGALQFTEICGKMEAFGKSNSIQEIRELDGKLREEIAMVKKLLKDYGNFLTQQK